MRLASVTGKSLSDSWPSLSHDLPAGCMVAGPEWKETGRPGSRLQITPCYSWFLYLQIHPLRYNLFLTVKSILEVLLGVIPGLCSAGGWTLQCPAF